MAPGRGLEARARVGWRGGEVAQPPTCTVGSRSGCRALRTPSLGVRWGGQRVAPRCGSFTGRSMQLAFTIACKLHIKPLLAGTPSLGGPCGADGTDGQASGREGRCTPSPICKLATCEECCGCTAPRHARPFPRGLAQAHEAAGQCVHAAGGRTAFPHAPTVCMRARTHTHAHMRMDICAHPHTCTRLCRRLRSGAQRGLSPPSASHSRGAAARLRAGCAWSVWRPTCGACWCGGWRVGLLPCCTRQ